MVSPIVGERYVYKFVCDPDALFQMALAENHRNALKMEAAASITASNNNSNIAHRAGPGTAAATQVFGGGGPNLAQQHAPTLHQHQQQQTLHNRLHQHHSSIDPLHSPVDEDIGRYQKYRGRG